MITKQKVLDVLQQIAVDSPDEINPTVMDHGTNCIYTSPAGKHCLAGEALVRLGLSVPDVESHHNASTGVNDMLDITSQLGLIDIQAVDLLDNVQSEADSMATWGSVIQHVLNLYGQYA